MSAPEQPPPPGGGAQPRRPYIFFVDGVKYESEQSSITGTGIKAKIPNLDPSYLLYMEEPGDEPDKQIQDDSAVSLEFEHGPRRFYTVPPATFGT